MNTNNQRTIKFRVWDKINNNFYSKEILDALPLKVFLASENIQQFTGLLDKSGKEIYEGDIIQYQHPKEDKNKVLVRWTTEEYDNHPGFIINDTYAQCGSFEIIGNIFENPNLIKENEQ